MTEEFKKNKIVKKVYASISYKENKKEPKHYTVGI